MRGQKRGIFEDKDGKKDENKKVTYVILLPVKKENEEGRRAKADELRRETLLPVKVS